MYITVAIASLLAFQATQTTSGEWKEWKEDHSRRKEHIAKSMSAPDHLAALRATGMLRSVTDATATRANLGPFTWTNVGPVGNFGSNLGYNGRVAGVRVLADGVGGYWVYAGASGGGIWRAHSSAPAVWADVGLLLPNPSVRAFDIDPSDTQRFVVGTGDPNRYKGAGFFWSEDGGTLWNAAAGPTPDYVYRVEYLPENDTTLLAATSDGIARSTDDGESWSIIQIGDVTDLHRYPTNNIAYLAVQRGGGLLQSTTGGLSWIWVTTTGLPATATWGRATLDACRDDPGHWVLLIATPGGAMIGVYKSEDGGTSWTDIGPITPDIAEGQMGHAQAIAFAPDDSDTIYVAGAGMAATYTGGVTWTNEQFLPGLNKGHPDLTELYFSEASGDDILWICNDGGIYRHDRSGTNDSWNGSTSGLRLSQVSALSADRSGRVIGLQDNGELASLNDGATWTWLNQGDGGAAELTDPAAVDFWCWVGVPWGLYRSSGAATWTQIATPAGASASLHYDPFQRKIFIPAGDDVFSADVDASPVTWSVESGLAGLHTTPGYAIQELTGSRADGATLYIRFRSVLARDLAVATWNGSAYAQRLVTNLAPVGSIVETIASSAEWPGEFWVGFSGAPGSQKIVHTTNGGATFDDWTANLSSCGTVYSIVPTAFDPDTVYAGTEIGVFRTTDGGASWSPFQIGMPIVQVKDLIYVVDDTLGGDHRLIAGTYGRGLWSRDVPGRPVVYVDKKNTSGVEDGTFQYPYDTVNEALQAAQPGAILALRANDYVAPVPLEGDVKVVTWAGRSRLVK